MLEPEARGGDERFVAVLLEEHPMEDESELLSVVGEEFCVYSEVGKDGVGFCQDETIVLEHWRAAVGVDLEKLGGAAFTF